MCAICAWLTAKGVSLQDTRKSLDLCGLCRFHNSETLFTRMHRPIRARLCSWIAFLKRKKEKIGTRTKVCQAYMPQCAGNLPRRWQRRSRAEKGEKGEREVGVQHGSLQIFCVSVCVFGNKWYPRWKNVTLCPVFCDTLFKLQEKNKNKGGRKVTN